MRRQSYQRGSLTLKKRAKGPDVWSFRFREGDVYRSIIVGDVKQYPTKSLAEAAAEKTRTSVAGLSRTMFLSEAIDNYKKEDMPKRESTQRSLLTYLEMIRKRWGKTAASAMARDLVGIEQWVNGLEKRRGGPMSKKSKQHVKATLHVLFESIIRWGGLELQRNPISLVRVKGRPTPIRQQLIISVDQYHQLLQRLPPRVGMMVQLGMCLGLRASEILGLKWEDIDLINGTLTINRSVVGKHQDETKTIASNDELPLHENLIEALKKWKEAEPVIKGWLFGSPTTERPFHRDSLLRWYLGPAGHAVGISRIGWHAFRHTYRHMMRELELPLEVQQRLMRHSDIRTTSQYGGRKMSLKGHNAAVVEMVSKEKKHA